MLTVSLYESSGCLIHLTLLSALEDFVESDSCHITGTAAEVELNNEDRYPAVDVTESSETLQKTFCLTELLTRSILS
jgi:hypothetical protein